MENFIVSARKYRPSTFNTVIGQHAITGTLKNAIRNNQLAQAFLFCGPRGVGKTTCARILAKTINCKNLTSDFEPCNQCDSCKAFNESASFNIHELDAASNNSVDDIRNLVDQVRIPPQMGKYKVYIIDEVHMLSSQAFNAFLKTLEEPPAYAKFILATTEKHKIIPTILSRCQIFDFKRITVDDIAKHLEYVAHSEGVVADFDALHIIAHKADGALRDALSIFDQMVNLGNKVITRDLVLDNLNVLDYEYFFNIMDCLRNGNIRDTLLIINDVIDKGFDGQHFITGMGEHLRNLLMSFDAGTEKLIETSDMVRAKYVAQAKNVPVQMLIDALDMINKADVAYRVSNNKRLALEVPLIQICRLSDKFSAPSLSAETSQVPVIEIVTQPAIRPQPVVPKQNVVSESNEVSDIQVVVSDTKNIAEEKSQNTIKPPESIVNEPVAAPIAQSESAPKALPAQDVPVQSHHISSTSIKGITKVQPVQEVVGQPSVPDRTEPIAIDAVENCINKYAESKREESSLYFSALTGFKPEMPEKNVILLKVANTILEQEFNDRRNHFLSFLRDELKNDIFTFSIEVTNQEPEVKKFLTDKEKLESMFNSNPNVKELRDQLNLDFDRE